MSLEDVVQKARRGAGPYRLVRSAWKGLQRTRLPLFRPLAALLYAERTVRLTVFPVLARLFYREPLMRYRCASVGRGLVLEGSLPLILGNGRIEIGEDVVVGARQTWVVGFKVSENAELIIGNKVSINYQSSISVAKSVRIGDGTLIASNTQIYDNISHPLQPARRARGEQFNLDEATPVVIGKNVWIGSGAIILRGVTIGDNSVVAASSVVTKPVPPNTLVAGNPATVIRELKD